MEDIKEVALRESFEAWMRDYEPYCDQRGLLNRRDFKGSTRLGEYCLDSVETAWEAWRASHNRLIAELQKDVEPVAEGYFDGDEFVAIVFSDMPDFTARFEMRPLYTHPQPKAATVPDVEALALHLHDADPINAACGISIDEFRDSVDFDFYMRIANAAIGYAAPSLPAQSEGEQK